MPEGDGRTRCPLCACDEHRPSWLGATRYDGRRYQYRQCRACASIFCEPMPDAATLARMYGTSYAHDVRAVDGVGDAKEPGRVVEWLGRTPRGTFVELGCGDGSIVRAAADAGWNAIGFELDETVARRAAERTGARIVSDLAALDGVTADAVYFGDVLEHLTDVDSAMRRALGLLRAGGAFVAQGPLEANGNAFTLALRAARTLRPRDSDMAPYHVSLATARGQQRLFARFGLDTVEWSTHEAAWPAPERLGARDLLRPRALALFGLRRASQTLTALSRRDWGNRFFFVGRKPR